MSQEKVVVTVSVTGSMGDRSRNPYLPVTPKEIAESAVEAWKAGAAVAHIHVRDPETGTPSMDPALYREVAQRVRDHSDLILNLTTGPGARFIPGSGDPMGPAPGSTLCPPERRIQHVLELRPELCSLDVGSMNFGPHIFVNYLPHVEFMAEQIRDAGVKPELEVFEGGHVEIARHLIRTGRVRHPPLFQLCLGISWGLSATPESMIFLRNLLPPDAIWAGFGVGPSAFAMVAQAALLGGNVRVGFEDTFHLSRRNPARSNRELVENAVAILRQLGKEPATSQEAREALGLRPSG